MNQTLPRNIENYSLITEKDLPERTLSADELNSLRKFIKKYNSTPLTHMVVWLIIALFFLFLLIYNIDIAQKSGFNNFWILVLFPIAFLVGAFLEFRNIIFIKSAMNNSKVGILNSVWSKGNEKSNSDKTYYFDVLFTEDNTRCRNAICLKKEHSYAVTGEKILVFAFRNHAYGCKL